MKSAPLTRSLLTRSLLTVALALSLQTAAQAHAGHGDEFEATGNILPVTVNAGLDEQLGIRVEPIQATDNSIAEIMIPAAAIVEAEGKKWVFVQFEDRYEPVEVTTGISKGNRIEVLQNLSVGEQLVTQGSIMLYAQSLKAAGHHHHHDDDHSHARFSRKRIAAGGLLLLGIAGISATTLGRRFVGRNTDDA